MGRVDSERGIDDAGFTLMIGVQRTRVCVVGAGVAGLVAAHTLAAQGIDVIVLEGSDHVGGRMASVELDGHIMDTGAQFLSSGYSVLRALSGELGMREEWVAIDGASSILTTKGARTFEPGSAVALLRSGTLSFRAWLRLLTHSFRTRGLRDRRLSDYSAWADLDSETAAAWGTRCLGVNADAEFLEPLLQGFYFQSTAETSRALMAVVLAFGARQEKAQALINGMRSLPMRLAAGLDVRLNSPVSSIRTTGERVAVHTKETVIQADAVILAIPAPLASNILPSALREEHTNALLATSYAETINVGVSVEAAYRLPENLAKSYGLLFAADARTEIAAISFESFKRRPRVDHSSQLFNIMLTDEAAKRFRSKSDLCVVSDAVTAAEAWLPALNKSIRATHVARWPMAEPRSHVGRARQVAEYRRACVGKVPSVLLAGDYTSMPFTEGAAESGLWAAERLIEQLSHQIE